MTSLDEVSVPALGVTSTDAALLLRMAATRVARRDENDRIENWPCREAVQNALAYQLVCSQDALILVPGSLVVSQVSPWNLDSVLDLVVRGADGYISHSCSRRDC